MERVIKIVVNVYVAIVIPIQPDERWSAFSTQLLVAGCALYFWSFFIYMINGIFEGIG